MVVGRNKHEFLGSLQLTKWFRCHQTCSEALHNQRLPQGEIRHQWAPRATMMAFQPRRHSSSLRNNSIGQGKVLFRCLSSAPGTRDTKFTCISTEWRRGCPNTAPPSPQASNEKDSPPRTLPIDDVPFAGARAVPVPRGGRLGGTSASSPTPTFCQKVQTFGEDDPDMIQHRNPAEPSRCG